VDAKIAKSASLVQTALAHRLHTGRATPVWNGALLFIGFCILAMMLDVALTMVFASAITTDRDDR
jgi:hypothetical protein